MNQTRIIMFILIVIILLLSLFIYNKMKWEKVILKRQIALGTVNIEQHSISYFSLGSLSTLGFICFTILINPNIIDFMTPPVEESIVTDEITPFFQYYKEVPVNTLVEVNVVDYEFGKFNKLTATSEISNVVYGTVIGKETTENHTYLYVSITDNNNKISVIKVQVNNDNLILEVGSNYFMLLNYSVNHDFYNL